MIHSRYCFVFLLSGLLALNFQVKGQNPKGPPPKPGDEQESNQFVLDPTAEVPLTIEFDDKEKKEDNGEEEEEEKRNRNEYFGLKTRKGYTKIGFANDVVLEQFNYLKEFQKPGPYVREVYWYHTEKEQIVSTTSQKIDKENAQILHGPYVKKTEEGEILEEGLFYKGAKHGRWTRYNKNYILLDKHRYTKGWLRDSEITYYDRSKKEKIKEVIPKEYGKKTGDYYYFFENGDVAVKGTYKNDHKVGIWTEFFKGSNRIKKQIQYRKDPFNNGFEPFILKEYNKKGQIVYENTRK